jgi:SPX domain protein involved in polyphosphate accumulation
MTDIADQSEERRYERKFSISELNRYEIKSIITSHPAIFSEIYNERFINNLYLDNFNMDSYFESVIGSKERMKIRIRWYGNLFGFIEKPTLEFKIKSGLLGKKINCPLVSFDISLNCCLDTMIGDVLRNSEIAPSLKRRIICLEPSILNRYRRKYFQSADRNYRITVDSDMEFLRVNRLNNTFLCRWRDCVTTVIELKYDEKHAEGVDSLVGRFPFRINKHSKYVSGIERIYSW